MPLFKKYPDILNVDELCAALNIGKNTAYQLIKSGEIKSIQIGRVHKIPKVYLVEYVLKQST